MEVDRTKFCVMCGAEFEAKTAQHKYCSRPCESRRYREQRGGMKIAAGRHCRQCGTHFFPDPRTGANKQHCSDDCAKRSARESRSKFFDRNPGIKATYSQRHRDRLGGDGNLIRFYIRHPDAPRACQACGEDRVLDIAHRPGHERNGAWHSAKNSTWPDKVWVLCPTCHALIDRKGYDPTSLGLS